MGRRAQALVEFALVVPVFFTLLFAFLLLAVWRFDASVLDHAADVGARAGNTAMASLNAIWSRTPAISTPNYGATHPLSVAIFGPLPSTERDCFLARNAVSGSPNRNLWRLGWDWGCDPANATRVRAPLDAAALAPLTALGRLFVGAVDPVTVTACYLDANARPQLCRTVTRTGGVNRWTMSGSPDPRTAPAPSFIEVRLTATVFRLVSIPLVNSIVGPSIVLRSTSVETLDRFLPACPAPASASDVVVGSCGWTF
jgi:hypothetical protein